MTLPKTFLGFGFLLLLMLAAMLLGLSSVNSTVVVYQQQEQTTLNEQHANIQPGLRIRPHALKHGSEAGDIYIYLLTGGCAASTTWCGASPDLEKMHICRLSNGLVGAILQFGDEIMTGYFEDRPGYWEKRVQRENWEVCE